MTRPIYVACFDRLGGFSFCPKQGAGIGVIPIPTLIQRCGNTSESRYGRCGNTGRTNIGLMLVREHQRAVGLGLRKHRSGKGHLLRGDPEGQAWERRTSVLEGQRCAKQLVFQTDDLEAEGKGGRPRPLRTWPTYFLRSPNRCGRGFDRNGRVPRRVG